MTTSYLLIATLLVASQVNPNPNSTVGGAGGGSKPVKPPTLPGPVPSPWGERLSPAVQAAAQAAFVEYNKNQANPVDASTFAVAYGTWVGNLGESGYFDSLTKSLQKKPEAFVNLHLTPDQANQLVLKLANAGVKGMSAQRLMEISQRSTDLERMNLVRQISTPTAAQGLFADLSKQIDTPAYVRDPNQGHMHTVKDDSACKDLSNLMMLNVYSGNTFGALVTAAALNQHC